LFGYFLTDLRILVQGIVKLRFRIPPLPLHRDDLNRIFLPVLHHLR
jgi:hypothetical protein